MIKLNQKYFREIAEMYSASKTSLARSEETVDGLKRKLEELSSKHWEAKSNMMITVAELSSAESVQEAQQKTLQSLKVLEKKFPVSVGRMFKDVKANIQDATTAVQNQKTESMKWDRIIEELEAEIADVRELLEKEKKVYAEEREYYRIVKELLLN